MRGAWDGSHDSVRHQSLTLPVELFGVSEPCQEHGPLAMEDLKELHDWHLGEREGERERELVRECEWTSVCRPKRHREEGIQCGMNERQRAEERESGKKGQARTSLTERNTLTWSTVYL